jgi:hypothetical protein
MWGAYGNYYEDNVYDVALLIWQVFSNVLEELLLSWKWMQQKAVIFMHKTQLLNCIIVTL